jgi:hypothetical protein
LFNVKLFQRNQRVKSRSGFIIAQAQLSMCVFAPDPRLLFWCDCVIVFVSDNQVNKGRWQFGDFFEFGLAIFDVNFYNRAFFWNSIKLSLVGCNFFKFFLCLNMLKCWIELILGCCAKISLFGKEINLLFCGYNFWNRIFFGRMDNLRIRKGFCFHPVVSFQVENQIIFHS